MALALSCLAPALASAAMNGPVDPAEQTLAAEAGSTRATLTFWDPYNCCDGKDVRIRISRGDIVFSEAIPHHPLRSGEPDHVHYSGGFNVGDLDHDGEPEVMVELDWYGTHCCHWSRIYRFDAVRETYIPMTHFWGNSIASPEIRDLDEDGLPEFVSRDDRFALTGYAGVVEPIQIWRYEQGALMDITRQHPEEIKEHAGELWRLYREQRGKDNVRYFLLAWAADQHLLGNTKMVQREFERARAAGYLRRRYSPNEGSPRKFLRMARRVLRDTGYLTPPPAVTALFAKPVPPWGTLELLADGSITATGFNDYIWREVPSWWADARAAALILFGAEDAPPVLGRRRAIDVSENPGDRVTVTITLQIDDDDSVSGQRYKATFELTPRQPVQLIRATWSQRCIRSEMPEAFTPTTCR